MNHQLEPFALTLSPRECAGLVTDLYRAAAAAFANAAWHGEGAERPYYESLVDAWEGETLAGLARAITEALHADSGSTRERTQIRFVTLAEVEGITVRIDGESVRITIPDSLKHSTGADLQPYIAARFAKRLTPPIAPPSRDEPEPEPLEPHNAPHRRPNPHR